MVSRCGCLGSRFMSSSLPETWTEVAMQDFAEGIFAYCSCKAPATQITAYPAALPNLRSTLLLKWTCIQETTACMTSWLEQWQKLGSNQGFEGLQVVALAKLQWTNPPRNHAAHGRKHEKTKTSLPSPRDNHLLNSPGNRLLATLATVSSEGKSPAYKGPQVQPIESSPNHQSPCMCFWWIFHQPEIWDVPMPY